MVAASDSPLSLAVVSVAHFASAASFSLMVCFERSSTLLIASANIIHALLVDKGILLQVITSIGS